MKRFVHEANPMDMLDAFEKKIEQTRGATQVEASHEDWADEAEDCWELLESKSVYDWDGFLTEYTLWHNTFSGEYACFFGDADFYNPDEDADPDAVFNDRDEAYDWFYSYEGFEDEDIY